MNEWERIEKERKLREQAEATIAFINMILGELTEAKGIIRDVLQWEDKVGTHLYQLDRKILERAEAFLKLAR